MTFEQHCEGCKHAKICNEDFDNHMSIAENCFNIWLASRANTIEEITEWANSKSKDYFYRRNLLQKLQDMNKKEEL